MCVLEKPMNEIIISLGSNIQPRFQHLKNAVKRIDREVGEVSQYSKIYKTPAWGFISTPFLNACVLLKTSLSTLGVLKKLQIIEKDMGRLPKKGATYEARPIDLDIIYSSEGVFNTQILVVPHRLLHKRKFVLVPLNDLIPNSKHPLLHLTNKQLLENCTDSSEIEMVELLF